MTESVANPANLNPRVRSGAHIGSSFLYLDVDLDPLSRGVVDDRQRAHRHVASGLAKLAVDLGLRRCPLRLDRAQQQPPQGKGDDGDRHQGHDRPGDQPGTAHRRHRARDRGLGQVDQLGHCVNASTHAASSDIAAPAPSTHAPLR